MLAYLCGPIEFARDGGRTWRRNLAPFLRDVLGHGVYDPAEDEQKNLTEDEAAKFRSWKTSDPERFRGVIRKIINFDLNLIEKHAATSSATGMGRARRAAGRRLRLRLRCAKEFLFTLSRRCRRSR